MTGSVYLDGDLLPAGTVAFHPVAGGVASYGQVDGNGRYEIRTGRGAGLLAGEYDVTVVAYEAPVELRPANGGPPTPGKRLTPERYGRKDASGLRLKVEPGKNTLDLKLTTTPSA